MFIHRANSYANPFVAIDKKTKEIDGKSNWKKIGKKEGCRDILCNFYKGFRIE